MKRYIVKIDPEALADIQQITDWYNEAQTKHGKRFQETTIKQIDSMSKDPQIYTIRYKEIRCMLVKKFPYMAHFYINEVTNIVEVLAVISTHRDPIIWEEKYIEKGIPAEWVDPLKKLGFTTISKLKEVEKHTKLHQDLCGYNKKNKLGLQNPSQDDVKAWLT